MTVQRPATGDLLPDAADDHVVLLDDHGRASGTAPRRTVHGAETPFHLGFSCHVVDRHGRVLLTRRALGKPTWPGAWTNACCGHPRWGETLRDAVVRRMRDELGVSVIRLALAVPDFTYRAVMPNGIVEHELCPIVVAEIDEPLSPNRDEVDDTFWLGWHDLCARAHESPDTLTPWSAEQVRRLAARAASPRAWFDTRAPRHSGLDQSIGPPQHAAVPLRPSIDPMAPLREPLERVLAVHIGDRSREAIGIDPALAPLVGEIARLVATGGKRLRPAFVYWGARAGGADHDEDVITVAAAVELLHTFALLHDDVMDRSDVRRGRSAAWRELAAVHARERLAGDAEWFGASAAILAGDLAFVWADQLFDAANFDNRVLTRARSVFTTLRTEVMAGQYLDLRLPAFSGRHEEEAQRIALLKSGRYTVTRPLHLGLVLAGEPDPTVARALGAFGDAVGVAFQMRDDVLGLFGDPCSTGKGVTDDLRAGKRTVLMLRALTLTDGWHRKFLARCLGDPELDEASAERCRAVVASSGARASVEVLACAQHQLAIDALRCVPEPARGALEGLASAAIERTG